MTFWQDLPDSRLFWFCLGLLAMGLLSLIGAMLLGQLCARDEEEPEEDEEEQKRIDEEFRKHYGRDEP